MNKMQNTTVDVRQVPPPQRHPMIFKTFSALAPGEAMILINDHDPKPLYYQFQAEMPGQFAWTYLERGPQDWRVEIVKQGAESSPGQEALSILLREHREMEKHLALAREWIGLLKSRGASVIPEVNDKLSSFGKAVQEDLALHIAHEDQALFPVLARYIGDQSGPIFVMLTEHRHLENAEARFRTGLQQSDPEAMVEAASAIVTTLTAHIGKEENILFPMAQQTLRPSDWMEVLQRIQAQN